MKHELLNILVCPLCKGKLEYASSTMELICHFDKKAFPIKDNIPFMIEREARNLVGIQ